MTANLSPATPSPIASQQDETVKAILANFDLAIKAAAGSYFVPLAGAVGLLRTGSLAADATRLRPSQKTQLINAIRSTYHAVYPSMADDTERNELNMSVKALAHLALVWAGEIPKAGPSFYAHDFVLAFELNLCQLAILDRIVERNKAEAAARIQILNDMLKPGPDGVGPTEH